MRKSLNEAQGLRTGDVVHLKIATFGDDHDGEERSFPPGAIGRVIMIEETSGDQGVLFHVEIGYAPDADTLSIVNVFDATDGQIGEILEKIG